MPRIQSLKQLANLKNFSKFFNYKTVTDHVIDSLAKEGERIIKEAYELRNWHNRTYNLYNSYVAAVIANGKVRAVRYLGPEHEPDPDYAGGKTKYDNTSRTYGMVDVESGRREAENFVLSYAKQHKSKKITLVVAATMFYAGILESNGYHVLTNVDMNMQDIVSKGLHLTDFKIGNMFRDFKVNSNAALMIGREHIAYRREEMDETDRERKNTFDTRNR